jgi:GntR family transcriptional repressor for pyruvate dehydrogenase complex
MTPGLAWHRTDGVFAAANVPAQRSDNRNTRRPDEMTFQLREIDRGKLYTSIVDQILEGIRTSAFPPGAALPPERILAERLGVSRSSVREAIRVLEHAGVLDVRTGSGTYVTQAALSEAMALRAHAALIGEHSPLDVMVARRALEPVCARLAAENRSRQDMRALRAGLKEQAAVINRDGDPTDLDLAFHLSIAAASHNPSLVMLIERLVAIMRKQVWRELKHLTLEETGIPQEFLAQHGRVLEFVESGNSEGAAQAMDDHLTAVEQRLLNQVVG